MSSLEILTAEGCAGLRTALSEEFHECRSVSDVPALNISIGGTGEKMGWGREGGEDRPGVLQLVTAGPEAVQCGAGQP